MKLSSKAALCLQDHQNSYQGSSKVASKPDHESAYKRETVVHVSSLPSRSSQVTMLSVQFSSVQPCALCSTWAYGLKERDYSNLRGWPTETATTNTCKCWQLTQSQNMMSDKFFPVLLILRSAAQQMSSSSDLVCDGQGRCEPFFTWYI